MRLAYKVCVMLAGSICAVAAWCATWEVTRFEYAPSTGLPLKKIYPDGHEISYTYIQPGFPKRITYASGKWKERRYNDRLQTVANVYSSENTPDVSVLPNELGTITSAEDAGGLVYDYGIRPLGQLLTNEVVTCPWMNWSLSHSHDRYSRETGLALTVDGEPKGRSSWHYDAEGRFAGLVCTNSHGRAIEVCYAHVGSRICGYSVRLPSGESFEQIWGRDDYRRELVKTLTVKFSGAVLLERSCEYDALGKLTHWLDVGTTYEGSYWYGRRGEIVQADVAGVRYGYGFDSAANCIGFSIGSTTNYFRANQLNQCTELISPSVGASISHEYDLDGNLVCIPGMASFTWDDENRLLTATVGQNSVTNRYDYQNRLVRQDLPGKTRLAVFDRWNLIYERFEDGANLAEEVEYFWGPDKSGTLDEACGVGGLVAVSRNGSFYFPYYGTNGEILGYVSEGGGVVASFAYGPFGEPSATGGHMSQMFSFRYMTKRWDPVLGLYDFGERWYSVALRRWISRDPLGEDGGLNLYAFCNNDPVNTFDPNGCIPLDTIWDFANVAYDICVGDKVSLATDVAALLTPYVPAGATKLVKAARLSKVKKVCPGVKKMEVTYEYVHVDYHFTKGPRAAKDWISMTRGKKKSYWKPQTSDSDVQGYIDAALRKAKSEGKVKPSQLKGYEYDVGRPIGATNGRVTSRIKIQIDSNGYIHAHPWP